jgi:beta-galactosidase
MVALWTIEAMAHGAELVSYFRWRQYPKAQEQMHSGLLRPDSVTDQGGVEARQAADLIARIGVVTAARADVALIFDYPSDWATQIEPQGQGYRALRTAFEYYTALRENGLSVDIVRNAADAADHALVVAPCAMLIDEAGAAEYGALSGALVLGPRSGSKTPVLTIPAKLAPGPLADLIPLTVARVESLRPGLTEALASPLGGHVHGWLEYVETALTPRLTTANGRGVWYQHGRVHYLAAKVDADSLRTILASAARDAGLAPQSLPSGLRLRRSGTHLFAFNYAPEPVDLSMLTIPAGTQRIFGDAILAPAQFAVWRTTDG